MGPMEEISKRIEQAGLWEKKIELNRGDFLKHAGDFDSTIYLVEKGAIRIFMTDESEDELTIRFGYKGNIFTDLECFITEKPSDLSIQAIRSTSLKCLSRKTYLGFIHSDTENERLWNEMLTLLVHMQMEREKDILTSSPKARYTRVLKRSPQLFQEIPLKYIASYLRMSPETLSRLRADEQ